MFPAKIELTQKELEKIMYGFDYKKIVRQAVDVEKNLSSQQSLIEKLKAEITLLNKW